MSDRRGFSLIELLVVMGIISLLVALVLPVLGQSRQTARQLQGLGQLRQIGSVIQMYVGDFDDYMLPSNFDTQFTTLAWQAYLWAHYLERNESVFHDPQLTMDEHFTPATSSLPYDEMGKSAYVMNVIRPRSSADGWGATVTSMTTQQKRQSSGWTGVAANTINRASSLPVRITQARSGAILVTDHRAGWATGGSISTTMLVGVQRWLQTDHGDDDLAAAADNRRKVGMHQPAGRFNALIGDGSARTISPKTEPAESWVAYVRP